MNSEDPREQEARRVVLAYSDLILRLSYTYLNSTHDAEDICQDVLLKLLQNNPAPTNSEHEKAWVIRATINACKDMLRSSFRKTSVELDKASAKAAPAPPDDRTLEAVLTLPQKYREALHLYYYEGYSVKEIARITNQSEHAISAHLSRGRKQLRDILEENHHG